MNPPGDTLLLRNSPDRRDDRAEALFATDFFTMIAVATHTVDWQKNPLRTKGQARARQHL